MDDDDEDVPYLEPRIVKHGALYALAIIVGLLAFYAALVSFGLEHLGPIAH